MSRDQTLEQGPRYHEPRRTYTQMNPKVMVPLLLALAMGGLLVLRVGERWNDRERCWGWTPGKLLARPGGQTGNALPMSKQPESFRSAVERCVEQRRAHRRFGVFTTTKDRAALSCERRWDQYRLGIRAVAASNGITDPLDPSVPGDHERFLKACVPVRARELRGSD